MILKFFSALFPKLACFLPLLRSTFSGVNIVAIIAIEKTDLTGAEQLGAFLERRMADVFWHEASNASTKKGVEKSTPLARTADAYVCSRAYADARGGVSSVVETARGLKASRILILERDSNGNFSVSTEMKGNLVHLNMAAGDCTEHYLSPDFPSNYSLQMACTLLLDDDYVAVADQKSLELMALSRRVSKTDVTVFINGPTGTGKEVLARFIHNQSGRREAPFVAVNCAAIPENMLEAILFGHEKGAFTGASTANKGIFRAADGGTLLLDEISEMPLSLQAKLLRALQEKKVTPLGSQRELDVDVRVIATTNRNMIAEVREGRFREDLFYRLNVFPLTTRHLHDRKDDIIAISTILLKRHCMHYSALPALDASAVETLMAYNWPGNVRELENVLQRALVLCVDNQITAEDIMVDGVVDTRLSERRLSLTDKQPELRA
jgi:two-component system response regulator FlrC